MSMKQIIKKVICLPFKLLQCLFVIIFGLYYYELKYLKCHWFSDSIFAAGWSWAWIDIWHRILFHKNKNIPWPCSPYIDCTSNVFFDPEDLDNFNQQGNYFQSINGGKIYLGRGTKIAKNVGIITSNHDLNDLELHQQSKNVIIGECCWVGMNSMILPGVELGLHTIVGAGSVVTKSFSEGYCIIAGNPAKKIRDLEK